MGAPPDPFFSPLSPVCQVPAGPGVAVAAGFAVGVGGSAQVSVVLRGILRAVPAVRLLPASPGQPRLVARCRDGNGKPGGDTTALGGAQNTPGHCQTRPPAASSRPKTSGEGQTSGAVSCGGRWRPGGAGRAPGGRGSPHGLVGILVELPAGGPGSLRGGEHGVGHRFGRSLDGAEQGFTCRAWERGLGS